MYALQKLIESQVRKTLAESVRGFNFRHFQQLESYEEMYAYADAHLDPLGSGVGRTR